MTDAVLLAFDLEDLLAFDFWHVASKMSAQIGGGTGPKTYHEGYAEEQGRR